MVEFGLKLEDNKVDRWSEQYIDYEKLKAVLKRAKAAAEYRDELLERTSPQAAALALAGRKNRPPPKSVSLMLPREKKDASSPIPPNEDPPSIPTEMVEVKVPPPTQRHTPPPTQRHTVATATDATPLLPKPKSPVKHVTSGGSLSSWGSGLNRAMMGVTSFVGLADDQSLLRQAYDDADDRLALFKHKYEWEVNKVEEFYEEMSDELSQRMEVLVESVSTSGLQLDKQKSVKSLWSALRFSVMHGNLRVSDGSAASFPGSRDVEDPGSTVKDKPEEIKEREEVARKLDSIKRALTDIYRTAKLLHNYSIMNYTGFVKIAKKFDKAFPEHKGMFKDCNCDDGKDAEILAAKMERMFAKWFCDGEVREAQAQMLPKKGDGLLMDWTQLRLGYRLGMCSILAMWVAWDCVWGQFARGQVSIGGRSAFPVFRGCFGLLAWHWFWGVSVYVWTRHRINYIYLFEFDPRNVDSPSDIFNDAVDETLVFLICMLMYYKADAGDMPLWIPPRAYPSFLILYTIKCLIFPWKQRRPLWKAIKEVITAPLVSPTFFLTYVGDVFTSMVKVFQDILWTVCFVVSGDFLISELSPDEMELRAPHPWTEQFWYKNVAIPLICLMPLWVRFMQCLRRYFDTGKRMPNLANAFKYAMSQSVTLFGAFHPLYLMHESNEEHTVSLTDDGGGAIAIGRYHSNLFQFFWMGLFVASSLYSFFWDVYMDWGLGRQEYGFLGPRLMFPRKSYYYSVIGIDLVLRSMWVLTLIPPQSGAKFELPAYLSAISMTVELFRRTIWSFFRLENEHRQNTAGFRRVNVVPLHFNTEHKHKYQKRHWVGWKMLAEIVAVTAVVVAISAVSVIVAQRATQQVRMSEPTKYGKDL